LYLLPGIGFGLTERGGAQGQKRRDGNEKLEMSPHAGSLKNISLDCLMLGVRDCCVGGPPAPADPEIARIFERERRGRGGYRKKIGPRHIL
jgi:hypothetical protein